VSVLNPVPIRRPSGFTLVEVLVAMTLFSLILTGLFGSLYASGRSWESAESRMVLNDQRRLVTTFVRQRIEQAVPLRIAGREEPRMLFRGGADELDFVAPLPAHSGGAGLHQLKLRVRTVVEGRRALILDYVPVAGTDAQQRLDDQNAKSVEVATELQSVEFAYHGSREPDVPPRWHDTWQDADVLPEFVRLRFNVDRDQSSWPELLIPIRAREVRGQNQFMIFERAADS
jgi:general secretion pathway protein J